MNDPIMGDFFVDPKAAGEALFEKLSKDHGEEVARQILSAAMKTKRKSRLTPSAENRTAFLLGLTKLGATWKSVAEWAARQRYRDPETNKEGEFLFHSAKSNANGDAVETVLQKMKRASKRNKLKRERKRGGSKSAA